jgi:hypothetical protein
MAVLANATVRISLVGATGRTRNFINGFAIRE